MPEAPLTHPIAADTITVTHDENNTWTLTITVPDRQPVAVTGTYKQMQEALDAAAASVRPTETDRQAIATQLWDRLTAHIRDNAAPQCLLDDELTIDEVLDGIEAFEFGADEWENGYFPSGATALGTVGDRHGADLEIRQYLKDAGEDLEEIVSEHCDDLILLSGDAVGQRWSYLLDRPADRPAALASAEPATA